MEDSGDGTDRPYVFSALTRNTYEVAGLISLI